MYNCSIISNVILRLRTYDSFAPVKQNLMSNSTCICQSFSVKYVKNLKYPPSSSALNVEWIK